MNDVTFVEAARKMAERVLREGGSETDARLNYALRLATARTATAKDLETLRASLAWQRDAFTTNPAAAEELLSQGASPRDKTIPAAEHAAWTAVCSLILNLDETVSKE